jgi:TolB-like protein
MPLILTLLSFVLVSNLVAAEPTGSTPAAKPNIAVLSFSGDETVTPQQLAFITGEFASELSNSGVFTVLDRNRMDDILKEQGFQQSGACSSSECKLQMGQMLGVDNLVVGSMVRFGPNYAFRVEYLDVATGVILKTVSFEKAGELHQVYRRACAEGAATLARFVRFTRGDAGVDSAAVVVASKPADASSVTTLVLPKPVAPAIAPPVVAPVPVADAYKRPGWKHPVGLGLVAGGVACAVVGFLQNSAIATERDAYESAVFATGAEADAQWKKVTDAQSGRNLFWGIGAGLLAAGLVVEIAF